jgi:hypothetical protein
VRAVIAEAEQDDDRGGALQARLVHAALLSDS